MELVVRKIGMQNDGMSTVIFPSQAEITIALLEDEEGVCCSRWVFVLLGSGRKGGGEGWVKYGN
jgi:hypothetical protein